MGESSKYNGVLFPILTRNRASVIISKAIDTDCNDKGGISVAEAEKLRFRKGDWLAIVLVAVIAVATLLCFLPGGNEQAAYAEIYLNGQLIKTVSLSEDQTFFVEDRYCNTVTVSGGSISISDSDCPGKDCVHSGSIGHAGRSLVCLPNAVEIRVISGESDVDFVVG